VRKDGQRHRARVERVGAQTINKSLMLLSAALNLAKDLGLLAAVPKINFLPEDDARAIVPPTEEQYRALIGAAEQLRPVAPLLPEGLALPEEVARQRVVGHVHPAGLHEVPRDEEVGPAQKAALRGLRTRTPSRTAALASAALKSQNSRPDWPMNTG